MLVLLNLRSAERSGTVATYQSPQVDSATSKLRTELERAVCGRASPCSFAKTGFLVFDLDNPRAQASLCRPP